MNQIIPTPSMTQSQLAAAGVEEILTEKEMAKLKAGYEREQMIEAATAATVGAYPQAAGLVDFTTRHFYDPKVTAWDPKLREGAIVALLTVHSGGEGLLLIVHFYWGLMEGLSINNICELLLLTGTYTGLPNFTSGVANLKTMLLELKKLAESDDPKAVQSMNVVAVMRTIFH